MTRCRPDGRRPPADAGPRASRHPGRGRGRRRHRSGAGVEGQGRHHPDDICARGRGTTPPRLSRVSLRADYERAIDQAAAFLDYPPGIREVLDAIDRLADDPRPPGSFPYGSPDLRRLRVGPLPDPARSPTTRSRSGISPAAPETDSKEGSGLTRPVVRVPAPSEPGRSESRYAHGPTADRRPILNSGR
jgi:hypothetical protein